MHRDPLLVAYIVFITLALAGNLVFFTIRRDVNSRLPPDQRYRWFRDPYGLQSTLQMFRDYRQLYPDDPLPSLYWWLFVFNLGTFLVMVLASRHGRS